MGTISRQYDLAAELFVELESRKYNFQEMDTKLNSGLVMYFKKLSWETLSKASVETNGPPSPTMSRSQWNDQIQLRKQYRREDSDLWKK